MNGVLTPQGTYGHVGHGGTCFWVDPENEIVGIYFTVLTRVDGEIEVTEGDLFQNMVTAAVAD